MSRQLSAARLVMPGGGSTSSRADIPQQPPGIEYKLPFRRKVYLPDDFLLPTGLAGTQIVRKHISSNHVYAWKHRFEEDLPAAASIPQATSSEIDSVHACAYWLKNETLRQMRKKLKTRMLELTRQHYGQVAANITGYTQLTAYLQSEVAIGNAELPFTILYGKESWPPSWEMSYAEDFCEEMKLYSRGEKVSGGKKYKAAFPRLFSYESGQLRARVKNIIRRQRQEVNNSGKKIRRRNKCDVQFDPTVHVKPLSSQTTISKNNLV